MDQFRKHQSPEVVGPVTRLESGTRSFTADNAAARCPCLIGMVGQIQQVTLHLEWRD